MAPELFSKVGKISVVFIFSLATIFSAYGVSQVEIDFDFDMFLTDKEMLVYKYRNLKRNFFDQDGETVYFYTNNTSLNYFTEES